MARGRARGAREAARHGVAVSDDGRDLAVLAADVDCSTFPPDRNPVLVLLASATTRESRASTAGALRAVLRAVGAPEDVAKHPERFPWHEVRYQHVAAMRAAMLARVPRPAPATVNARLSAVRSVVREARKLGLVPPAEAERVLDVASVPGVREPPGRALERREVMALVRAPLRGATAVRDRAIAAVLTMAGLRVSELAALDLADYDAAGGTVLADGKGNKQRRVPVHPLLAEALAAWTAARGDAPGPLFPGRPTREGPGRLTRQTIARALTMRAREAGLAHASPHDGRRTFISEVIDATHDLSVAARLAGHADVKTTMLYDRRGERAERAAVDAVRWDEGAPVPGGVPSADGRPNEEHPPRKAPAP